MTPELWQRLKPLYHAALDIPENKRAQFVIEACGNDIELRDELAALLRVNGSRPSADETTPVVELRQLFESRDTFAPADLVLGRFRIVRTLGSGGMGEVYEAIDLELGKVALKTIRADLADNPDMLARFKKEVQLARTVSGPNICRIYELFIVPRTKDTGTRAFLTMEYLEGTTLAEKIHGSGPLYWQDVRSIALEICEGLQAIHEAGIVHRDLKSRNIMLAQRNGVTRAVLMDFGLAREYAGPASSGSSDFTNTGAVVGTPDYMAPEQFEGKPVSPATDIYALGVVLYEMLTGEQPFAAATPMAAAVQRAKQLNPPSSIQPRLPRRWDKVIGRCLEFSAANRYQSAREVAGALKGRPIFPQLRWLGVLIGIITLLVLSAAAVSWWKTSFNRPETSSPAQMVAVLPFGNMGSDSGVDFLRLALPDEIATALSHVRSLSIRPFATTSKYLDTGVDIQRAGREIQVDTIVTGRFVKVANELQITLEAVDIDKNEVVWRDTLNVADQDLIAMRQQVLARIDNGLIPTLRPAAGAREPGSQPKNEEAYDLFLRSAAMPNDPQPNKEAIRMLERAVGLDSEYAPAWAALGQRCYMHSRYSDGGETAFRRATLASERAKALDPDLVFAIGFLVTIHAEQGELETAYSEAKALVNRRPENGFAHFSLAYVLRFAGLSKESQRECETALALDPGNYQFRSCARAFYLDGNYQRAAQFLNLDPGSDYANRGEAFILLRQGRAEEALDKAKLLPEDPVMALLASCIEEKPVSDRDALSQKALSNRVPDPEILYWTSGIEAFCGRSNDALEALRQAVSGGYCSYPALDSDPLLTSVRNGPEFQRIRADAVSCQEKFLAYRSGTIDSSLLDSGSLKAGSGRNCALPSGILVKLQYRGAKV